MRQILYNLISNAVKFTAEGEVRVSIDRRGENIFIRVSDSGVGIASDQIAGIFDRFVQADSSTTRKHGGSGLGLAITRDLCTAMGGAINATSELGAGTVFEVVLPLQGVATVSVDSASQPADDGFPEPIRAFNILAAEDNPINQLVLKTLLAQFDLSVTIVENGVEAVASWRTGDWGLILMDVQMPVLDGPSAARQIRDLEVQTGRAPVPIVALTANAMVHQIETYYAAGMNDVIAKPIDVRDLLRVIQAVANAESYVAATESLKESRAA
jgi:CheY-like chemotaxis protein